MQSLKKKKTLRGLIYSKMFYPYIFFSQSDHSTEEVVLSQGAKEEPIKLLCGSRWRHSFNISDHFC